MSERWQAAKDVLVIGLPERVAVVTHVATSVTPKIRGIYSTALSAHAQ